MVLKPAFLILIFAFISPNPDLFAENQNYCLDHHSWKQWDELAQKYPADMDVQALHALRIGLCAKVEQGSITLNQATDIFERIRESIVEKKKKENEISESRKKL